MQVRLPDEFLDQAARVDPQHQGVTVANARGFQDGVGFLGPLVGGRGRSVGHRVRRRFTGLRSGKGQNASLGRHDEQLLVGCQHPLRRAFDFRTPHDLRFLAGRVNRFHDARPADIEPAARLDVHVELRGQFPKLAKHAAEVVRNLVLGAV